MNTDSAGSCIAFAGYVKIASGSVVDVALAVKTWLDRHDDSPVLVFDDLTSAPVELDLRGTSDDVVRRYELSSPDTARSGPGRPKLGVVAREVTLLPRHWEWLASQPGGASTTLRRLVDDARKTSLPNDMRRQALDAAYKFMAAVAGNLPHYENALRALYKNQRETFETTIEPWPTDVRVHTMTLVNGAWGQD